MTEARCEEMCDPADFSQLSVEALSLRTPPSPEGGWPILRRDDAVDVRVDWAVSPPATASLLDGTWTATALAVTILGQRSVILQAVDVPASGTGKYSVLVRAALSSFQPRRSDEIYRLDALVTYRTQTDIELAASSEGGAWFILAADGPFRRDAERANSEDQEVPALSGEELEFDQLFQALRDTHTDVRLAALRSF
jgi:hypothetical protein